MSSLQYESRDWPQIKGDYTLGNVTSPCAVAIVGRGQVEIPTDLYSIMGHFKTENMGIEKIIMNVVSNPRIRFLVICGKEEFGHFPGDALLGLFREGVDEDMRISDTRAAIPFLCNIPLEAVDRFKKQVEAIDLVHPKDVGEIIEFDPIYYFDEERTSELVSTLKDCMERDPGPLDASPIHIRFEGLNREVEEIGDRMNKLADFFTNQMLRMPSQRLSTKASIALISEEFRIVLDPVDMEVVEVPSVDLAMKLKSYLMGGE